MNHLPRAPTSRTRLNPHAGALPQKSTHQLRSCSWPEVHTINKVQNERFNSTGCGAHDRQRSGAIPAQPSQTDRIVASEVAPCILRFLPVTRYFFGKNFSHADLGGAREWNMQRNDVILGVLNFFRVSGGSVGVVGCIDRAWQHG